MRIRALKSIKKFSDKLIESLCCRGEIFIALKISHVGYKKAVFLRIHYFKNINFP
jgi:hypothetical protein